MKFVKACHCIVDSVANGRLHSPTQRDGGGHCSRSASSQKRYLYGRQPIFQQHRSASESLKAAVEMRDQSL